MSIKKQNNKGIITYLKSVQPRILVNLQKVVADGNFNYRTFGTEIENYLSDIIVESFKKNGYILNDDDYKLAPHKNYFPDFSFNKKIPLAIEFKSGNKSQFRNGKWISVKNSENDMGTLNQWPTKIKKFGGENIFYIFIIYNFNDKVQEILKIEIEPFYKFLGLNKKGDVLKYREKDGNLRPKDFDVIAPIKNFKQFESLLDNTNIYRSKRIIIKHKKIIRDIQKKIKT